MKKIISIAFFHILIIPFDMFAQDLYSDVSSKLVGRWYFGTKNECFNPKYEKDETIYTINKKGKLVIETKVDSTLEYSGVFTNIEPTYVNKHQYKMITENIDFDSGEKKTKKSIVQFNPEYEMLTVTDMEINGVVKVKDGIILESNSKNLVSGYKCLISKKIMSENINAIENKKNLSQQISQAEFELQKLYDSNNVKLQQMSKEWDGRKWVNSERYEILTIKQDEIKKELDAYALERQEIQKKRELEAQKTRQEKDAADARYKKNRADEILNNCLNSGKISVCSLTSNYARYKCGRKKIAGIFGPQWIDDYCEDEDNYVVKFKSKNNLNQSIKDVIFRCESVAKSGTILGSSDNPVYDLWHPQATLNISITIPRINQTEYLNCYAKSWK